MIRIALCDDNLQELNSLMSLLQEYKEASCENIVCRKFLNSTELLDALRQENYTVVFLDIIMPNVNEIGRAHV